MASSSSGCSIIGLTQATCGLTDQPTGTHDSASVRSYSPTQLRASSGSMNAKVSAPMPFSAASRIVSRREQATHSGGCGFCIGLGTTLRGGIFTYSPSTPVNGVSTMQRTATSSPSSHCSRLMSGSMPKPAELGLARRLTRAELDPAVGHEVEHRHPLGRAGRVVEAGRGEDDPVAEADVLRALAAGGQEDLGRRRVAVLLEEVVFHLPHVLDAEAVGQLHLLQRVLDEAVLAVRLPRPPHLVLVEDPELHSTVLLVVEAGGSVGSLPRAPRPM